jgi:soluble lytic murein transglycosylase-like protein
MMTKKFGVIFALLGAVALFGSNPAFSEPAQPTNLRDLFKAKRAEAEKAKAQKAKAEKAKPAKPAKAAKAKRAKAQGQKVAAKADLKKKAELKKPAVKRHAGKKASGKAAAKARTRIKTVVSRNIDTMTTGSVGTAGGATKYSSIIASYASSYGVPVDLAHAVVRVESNFRPETTGLAGEIGLMQIKLSTARGLGYTGSRAALYNPDTNIRWGMKYLAGAHKLGNGTTCGTILRYNAGHGATRMNPVSANYCAKVKSQLASN